jgi:hypothetical protein
MGPGITLQLPSRQMKGPTMSQEHDQIEALKKDVFLAHANRAFIYTEVLREMRKELGEKRSAEIFKRALYNHGVNMAKMMAYPKELPGFKDWLLGFLPAGGALNEPEVVRSNEEELVVKFPRCPLKEAWRMAGLSDAEVADMCEHADAFDHGFFGSEFDYTMDLWSTQPDDACVLTFRPRKKAEKEK